jgi:hypothetical protein
MINPDKLSAKPILLTVLKKQSKYQQSVTAIVGLVPTPVGSV